MYDTKTLEILDFKATGAEVMQFLAEIGGIVFVRRRKRKQRFLAWHYLLLERTYGRGFNTTLITAFEREHLDIGERPDGWIEAHRTRLSQEPLLILFAVTNTYRVESGAATPFAASRQHLFKTVKKGSWNRRAADVYARVLGKLKTASGADVIQREEQVRELVEVLPASERLWVAVAIRL